MTVAIVPANGPWATINIPADGEAVSSASVLGYMQVVANELEFLRRRLPGASAPANLLTVGKPAGESVIKLASTVWAVSLPTGPAGAVSTLGLIGVSSTEPALISLDGLIPGAILRNFKAWFRGGVHAGLPAVMPKIELVKFSPSGVVGINATPTYTVVDTMVDASANTAAYQPGHIVTKAIAAPPTVGADEQWGIRIYGESGANSQVGLEAIWAAVDVSGA